MILEKKTLNPSEMLYITQNYNEINPKVGFIGELKVELTIDGDGFSCNWSTKIPSLNTTSFKEELDNILESLRFDVRNHCVLLNLMSLSKFCWNGKAKEVPTEPNKFCFKIETEQYTYLFLLIPRKPNMGHCNCKVFCYLRKSLERHISKAQKGMHFHSDAYDFVIDDGGMIKLRWSDVHSIYFEQVICRYIDENYILITNSTYLDGIRKWKINELITYLKYNKIDIEKVESLPF